ncbi:flagellar biosynthesis protein FlhF [Persephonella sp.]
MEIKIYEGYNLEELIQKAKEELGEDIKIVHYETITERKWFIFGSKKRYKLFVEMPDLEEPVVQFDDIFEKIEEIIDKKIQQTLPKVTSPAPVIQNIETGQQIIPEQFNEFSGEALELINQLLNRDVLPDVAKKLVKEGCGLDIDTNKWDLNTLTTREALIKGIRKYIKFTGAFDKEKEGLKILTFIGPTGVGKTTNLFKIASHFVINQKMKVAVISTDTFKVGATQQARIYANILNIPFYSASESKKLKSTVSELENYDFILVDTVGRSHYDYWRLGEIKEILGDLSENMHIVLTVSCNFKNEDAFEVVNRYSSFFDIDSLLFTKIDETSKPGLLLNLPVETKIPVSYISTGQRVPEDIKILKPENIASYILGD